VDACPGRLNEVFFRVDKPSILYGQCSEICGVNHAYMPIQLYVTEPSCFEENIFAYYYFQDTNKYRVFLKKELMEELILNQFEYLYSMPECI